MAVFHTVLFDPYSFEPDGAYYQYKHIQSLIDYGHAWQEAAENPIILTHLFRYAVYWPFTWLGEREIGLQYALLAVISFPVVNHYWNKSWHVFLLLPLIAGFFISYRAVLAAMSIGYVVIYLFSNRQYPYLLMGLFLSFLSSAVSLQVFLLLLVYGIFRDRMLLFKLRVLIPLGIFFVIVLMGVIEKYQGFATGGAGYAATTTVQQTSVLLAILSRGTLYYDLLRGSMRGYAYLLIGLVLTYLILRSFLSRDPARKDHRFVLFTLAPGFLAEGLGVTAIMMVFIWSLFKADLNRNRFLSNQEEPQLEPAALHSPQSA